MIHYHCRLKTRVKWYLWNKRQYSLMLSMLNALSWPSCCLRLRIARLSQSQTARQYQDIAKRSWLRFLKGILAFCYHWSVVVDWCNTQINYNKNGLQRKRSNRMNRMNRKETCRRYKNGSMINTLVTAWACGLPWWSSWGRAVGVGKCTRCILWPITDNRQTEEKPLTKRENKKGRRTAIGSFSD